MAKTDKDISPPVVSSLLVRGASLGLVAAAVIVSTRADFGVPTFEYDGIQDGALAAMLPLYWSCFLLLMFWMYRANRYLEENVHQELETGPFMAGLGFIIPVLSLWKPYLAMREIYQASRNPEDWKDSKQASIIGVWWALCILVAIIGWTFKFLPKDEGSDLLPWFGTITRVLVIAKYALQFLIISRVMAWLARRPRLGVEKVF